MNILIINGSPRKKGLISQMLGIMQEEAQSNNMTVETVNIMDLEMKPCIGCMVCRTKEKCVLPEDDTLKVLEKLRWADTVIMGAPCYWGNMTGQLKMLFDRWVYGLMDHSEKGYPQPLLKGKKAIIVTTCTTPWPFNLIFKQSAGTVRAIKEVLCWSGFKITGVIQKGGTHNGSGLTPKEIAKCKKIAKKFHLSP